MRILNLRKDDCSNAVRVDRATKWGNPFKLPPGAGLIARKNCIESYRKWLWEKMCNADEEFIRELASLHNKDLACWCAPLPCHAEVLSRAAAWAAEFAVPALEGDIATHI